MSTRQAAAWGLGCYLAGLAVGEWLVPRVRAWSIGRQLRPVPYVVA
jgi:hypothetical protein